MCIFLSRNKNQPTNVKSCLRSLCSILSLHRQKQKEWMIHLVINVLVFIIQLHQCQNIQIMNAFHFFKCRIRVLFHFDWRSHCICFSYQLAHSKHEWISTDLQWPRVSDRESWLQIVHKRESEQRKSVASPNAGNVGSKVFWFGRRGCFLQTHKPERVVPFDGVISSFLWRKEKGHTPSE